MAPDERPEAVPLTPGCPRCRGLVIEERGSWACVDHGPVVPVWRPQEASYDAFAGHLRAARGLPTYLPWPLPPGWSITDFAVVGERGGRAPASASLTCTSGSTELDGPVDLVVVTEEAGVGLGARCAGVGGGDPGRGFSQGPPLVRVRVGTQAVPLWPILTGDLDRSVVAGEAAGRWLWIVLWPASAVMLLRPDWLLHDVSALGAPLLDLPFGGPPPRW